MPLPYLLQGESELGYLSTYFHQSLLEGCNQNVDSLAKKSPKIEECRLWHGKVRPVGTQKVRMRGHEVKSLSRSSMYQIENQSTRSILILANHQNHFAE